MEDYSKELLRSGIIEAKTGSHATARRYLDRAIYMTSSHDVLAEAWFWMGEVTADPAEKRKALENCLSHDLRHARARRALAIGPRPGHRRLFPPPGPGPGWGTGAGKKMVQRPGLDK